MRINIYNTQQQQQDEQEAARKQDEQQPNARKVSVAFLLGENSLCKASTMRRI